MFAFQATGGPTRASTSCAQRMDSAHGLTFQGCIVWRVALKCRRERRVWRGVVGLRRRRTRTVGEEGKIWYSVQDEMGMRETYTRRHTACRRWDLATNRVSEREGELRQSCPTWCITSANISQSLPWVHRRFPRRMRYTECLALDYKYNGMLR